MRRIAVLVALATLLVTAAPAHALHGGSISGRVTDGATGDGIEGICVWAEVTDEGWVYGGSSTDSDGKYTIGDLDPGDYLVRFYDCRYPAVYAPEYWNDAPDRESADPVAVDTATDTDGIDAALAVGGSITGTVTNADGEAIAYACVDVVDAEGFDYYTFAQTDEDGGYSAGGLPTGSFKVFFYGCYYVEERAVPVEERPTRALDHGYGDYVAEWYDDEPNFDSADPVAVTQGAETAGIDAVLDRAGYISGRITDERGAGVDGACATVYDLDGEYASEGYSYDGGHYLAGYLRAGDYKIRFSDCSGRDLYVEEWYDDEAHEADADLVTVVAGVETFGIDAVLARNPAPDLAVTGLEIHNVPIETDLGPVAPSGYNRTVTVDVANLGDAEADYGVLNLWAYTPTDGRYTFIGAKGLDLAPGESARREFRWNGLGTVGDATVIAEACHYRDYDRSNDRREADHYVLVGGSGFGVGNPVGFPDYYYGCEPVYIDEYPVTRPERPRRG